MNKELVKLLVGTASGALAIIAFVAGVQTFGTFLAIVCVAAFFGLIDDN
jgi:hypothetical protein